MKRKQIRRLNHEYLLSHPDKRKLVREYFPQGLSGVNGANPRDVAIVIGRVKSDRVILTPAQKKIEKQKIQDAKMEIILSDIRSGVAHNASFYAPLATKKERNMTARAFHCAWGIARAEGFDESDYMTRFFASHKGGA